MLPSLYGVEDFNSVIAKYQSDLDTERRINIDLQSKLNDSEHKRHDHLRKNLEL